MKILIIAIARLGDNLLCWPAIRAAKRSYPDAKIHVLARKRFSESFQNLSEIDALHIFDTAYVFEPQFLDSNGSAETIVRCESFLNQLRGENYSHIINMTFSTASAFLTRSLTTQNTEVVSGYSVHDDGCVFPVDDISAFYYAQGGIDGNNRFHLADIFATQCKVDLLPIDWGTFGLEQQTSGKSAVETDILFHLTSSSQSKTLSVSDWALLIKNIFSLQKSLVLGFIGSGDDVPLIEQLIDYLVSSGVTSKESLKNLAGTKLNHTLLNLSKTGLLVGADSAPIHLASHAKVKTYNISFCGKVRFWETGPRAVGSAVKLVSSVDEKTVKQMAIEITQLVLENELSTVDAQAINHCPSYEFYRSETRNEESWNLIQAIYMNKEIVKWQDEISLNAIHRLVQANQLILNQLELLSNRSDATKTEMAMGIIEQCDQIIDTLAKSSNKIDLIVRWYKTEKLRIPVCGVENTVEQMVKIHTVFKELLMKIIDSQKVLTVANSL
jgi:ADP-heptose:LPS heptosyltransferase